MIGRGGRRRYRKLTDEQLARAFTESGVEAYFDELFERYHVLIYGYCLHLTRQRERSKDLTLVTFDKARREMSGAAPEQFRHWLFTLCANACKRSLRDTQREERAARAWERLESLNARTVDNEAFPEERYARERRRDRLLREGLQTLSAEQRRCLELFVYERKSYREIADITGYSRREVSNYLQNGRLRLKRWIDRQGEST